LPGRPQARYRAVCANTHNTMDLSRSMVVSMLCWKMDNHCAVLSSPMFMPIPPHDEISPEMLALISSRLRPACPDIPEGEFERLVRNVARIRTKYDSDRFVSLASRTSPFHKAAGAE